MDASKVSQAVEELKVAILLAQPTLFSERDMNAVSWTGRLRHALWMADQIDGLMRENRVDKAMRWLGFLQGVVWSMNILSIEAMKRMNAPEEAIFDKDRR